MTVQVSATAEYQQTGLTLAELGEFVDQARALGCDPHDVVLAQVGWRGKVRSLTLTHPGKRGA